MKEYMETLPHTQPELSPSTWQPAMEYPARTPYSLPVLQLWKSPSLKAETGNYTNGAKAKENMKRYWELRSIARSRWSIDNPHGSGDGLDLSEILENLATVEQKNEYRKLNTWYEFVQTTPGLPFDELYRNYLDEKADIQLDESFKLHHIFSRSKIDILLGAMSEQQRNSLASNFRKDEDAATSANDVIKSLRSNLVFGPSLRGDDTKDDFDPTYKFDSETDEHKIDEVSEKYKSLIEIVDKLDDHKDGSQLKKDTYSKITTLLEAETLRSNVQFDKSKWEWHKDRKHWLKIK